MKNKDKINIIENDSSIGFNIKNIEGIETEQKIDDLTVKTKVNALDEISEMKLPILGYKREIMDSIKKNKTTIITAETGAGKSTMVPQFLLDDGYEVVVTQPRIMAARALSQYISKERGQKNGGEVGYKTAREGKNSKDTKLLFCTDGLQLVRELTSVEKLKNKKTVLVLDEVHEWNLNMEMLVAWAKKRMEVDKNFKLVIMSATMDSEKLAEYFSNEKTSEKPKIEAPVIDVPGRLYDVEKSHESEYQIVSNAVKFSEEGHNVLIFQPGKREIMDTVYELESYGLDAVILPLHGQLTPDEQQKIFKKYNRPVIVVSTNIAQTSLTIPYIDVVIDSGLERRIESVDGVEGLYLKNISNADCLQRAGRAGRVKKGKYILCSKSSLDERPKHPKAEIQRVNLSSAILKLAVAGINAAEVDFFHEVNARNIQKIQNDLISIGALDENLQVTKIGKELSKLHVRPDMGRSILEAKKYGCVEEMIMIASCLEVGGIKGRGTTWQNFTNEINSDLLAELDLYNLAKTIKYNKKNKFEKFNDIGVFFKNFERAKDINSRMYNEINKNFKINEQKKTKDLDTAIIKSLLAGMVKNLYTYSDYYNAYLDLNNVERKIDRFSVVSNSYEGLLIAKPKDFQFKDRRGDIKTMNVFEMCTKISPDIIIETLPHLVKKEKNNLVYSSYNDECRYTNEYKFNGKVIKKDVLKYTEPDDEILSVFVRNAFDGPVLAYKNACKIDSELNDLYKKISIYERRSNGVISFSKSDAYDKILKFLKKSPVITLAEFEEKIESGELNINDFIFKITDFVDQSILDNIDFLRPFNVTIKGQNYDVNYSYDSSASIELPVDLLFKISENDLKLPDDENIKVKCIFGDYIYNEKTLEDARVYFLEKYASKKIDEYKTLNKKTYKRKNIYKVEDVLLILEGKLKNIVVDKNINGSDIIAVSGLKYDGWDETAELIIDNDIDYVKSKTFEAVGYLLLNVLKGRFQVPNKMPFKNNDGLTSYGRTVEHELDELRYSIKEGVYFKDKTKSLKELISSIDEKLKELVNVEYDESDENVLYNFTHHRRRGGMSGNSDAWVIMPNGELRPSDINNVRRYKSDGDHTWNVVKADELALSWECGTRRDVDGSSDFIVNKLPVGGLTDEQLKAIELIEVDIEASIGSFGFNEEIEKFKESLVFALKTEPIYVMGKLVDLSDVDLNESINGLMGDNGINVDYYIDDISYMIDYSKPFETRCSNRDAQILDYVPLLDGYLEFVGYDKGGGDNVNMRYKKGAVPVMSKYENSAGKKIKNDVSDEYYDNAVVSLSSFMTDDSAPKEKKKNLSKKQRKRIERDKAEKKAIEKAAKFEAERIAKKEVELVEVKTNDESIVTIESKEVAVEPEVVINKFEHLDVLSEDEQWERYEECDVEINKIIESNEQIIEIYERIDELESEIAKLDINLKSWKASRGIVSSKRQKLLVVKIKEGDSIRKGLKSQLRPLKKLAFKMKDVKEELDSRIEEKAYLEELLEG